MQKPHVLLYLLAALTSHAFAGILPDSVKIATDEKKAQAEVSFRFEPNDPITTIQSARILGFEEGASTGTEVGDAQFTPFSNLEDHSIACAYVIDFAAQLRSTMKNKNFSKNTVRSLANTGSVTQTTIYSLGRDLEVISPLGDPTSTALDRLEGYNGYLKRPDGFKSSFIVQHLSEVVTKLKDAATKRKVIVLFTDGQDTTRNDTAWQWDTKFANVLALCKSNDIAVHVVGMAQDPKVWDKGYAWLRDLANGTGGLMLAATINEESVPQSDLAKFTPAATSGGRVTVDLSKVSAKKHWQVRLVTPLNASFAVPSAKQVVPEIKKDDKKDDPKKEDKKDPLKKDDKKEESVSNTSVLPPPWWMKPWVWAAAAVPVFLFLLLVVLLIFRKKPEPAAPLVMTPDEPTHIIAPQFAAPPVGGARRPLAWLEMMDAEGSRESISSTNVRIGRGKDNDLVLSNKSVSSHHCVIQQARDGTWSVNDLKSGNGVYVNDRRVEHSEIRDGDVIELGEVKMRFRTGH